MHSPHNEINKKVSYFHVDTSFTQVGPDVNSIQDPCSVMVIIKCPRCESIGPLQQRKSQYCQGLRPSAGLAENDLIEKHENKMTELLNTVFSI